MDAHGATENLCHGARDKRMRSSVLLFAVALLVGVWMAKAGISPLYRLTLFVPFALAGQGLFAALYGTCGWRAAQGEREVGGARSRIIDKSELASVKIVGRKVTTAGIVSAASFTLLLAFAA